MNQQPHRPGPLHQTNKSHKGSRRKSSAVSEIKNKQLSKPASGIRREDRLNQALQNRRLRTERVINEKRRLGAECQPPISIGVIDPRLNSCTSFFNGITSNEDLGLKVETVGNRSLYVVSTKLKMRFKLIILDSSNLDETIDIVKGLDILMLLYRPNFVDQKENQDFDQVMKAIRIHCLPSIVRVIDATTNSGDCPDWTSKLSNAKRILRSMVKDDKIYSVERPQDYLQLFHLMGNHKRMKSHFKEARAILLPDKAETIAGSLTLAGFLRNKSLSPNSLIHICGFDDYKIKQIEILPDPVPLKALRVDETTQILLPDLMKQESLEQENEIDPMEGEQTWPSAEELAAEAEKRNTKKVVKKLPPGTSEYQGAWIVDSDEEREYSDQSESGDENCYDYPMDEASDCDEYGSEDDECNENETEADEQSSMMDVDVYDKTNSEEKEMKILEKIREARLEEMFPDEVDTPQDIPARVRFARYRGLKSFRRSPWDPQENLPPDYSKIFQFQNFQATRRRVLSDESDDQAPKPGQYVRIHLEKVPDEVINSILNKEVPPIAVGLLKYERKMTVMNLLIKRVPTSGEKGEPIKSKEELIFFVGFRKFKARPLLTNHSMSSKFKYERFLRDDTAMVATIYAPVTFPPAPVLVFRINREGRRELIASGSVLDSDPNRLVLKRIRLSGHPFKIHSKSAVLRFMFFNNEDVLYFKPVELTSKYNRRGHIKEPLGTHGHMKCTFDRKIRSDDCIFMNLYKRVFPKWTYMSLG